MDLPHLRAFFAKTQEDWGSNQKAIAEAPVTNKLDSFLALDKALSVNENYSLRERCVIVG